MCGEPAELSTLSEKLHNDLRRWHDKLQRPDLGPTDVIGITAKAINQFEIILRQLLCCYLEAFGIDYDRDLRQRGQDDLKQKLKGQGPDSLTLGEVVTCLDRLNRKLTGLCRKHLGVVADALRGRKLLTEDEMRTLRHISNLRKSLHRKDMEETLVAQAPTLLYEIEAALKTRVFELCPGNRHELRAS